MWLGSTLKLGGSLTGVFCWRCLGAKFSLTCHFCFSLLPFFLSICIAGFMGLPIVPPHGCLPYPLGPADQCRNAVCLVSYVKHLLSLGIAYSSIYTHHLPALALFHTCSVYHDPTTHPVMKDGDCPLTGRTCPETQQAKTSCSSFHDLVFAEHVH